jgi:hypothetical protein
LFPATVTATDGLEALFVDYVPRWQASTRQALLDWIHRGGTLHVLHDLSGNFPEFTSELAVLNSSEARVQYGTGEVLHHARRRQDIDAAFLEDFLPARQQSSNRGWQADMAIFQQLKAITYPKHNWHVIHGLSLTYLVLICPGWFLLGRRRIDYRLSMLSFVAVTCLFSLAFNYVGRRGYGESTAVNAVAFAKPLADGQYDVTQWSNVFVTGGDTYRIRHAGSGQLYSTAQQIEEVNGIIENGLDGTFTVDMPLFSSRSFLHRMKVSGPPLKLTALWANANGNLEDITIRVEGDLPDFLEASMLYGNQLFSLSRGAAGLELTKPVRPIDLGEQFARSERTNMAVMRPAWFQDDGFDDSLEARYRSLFPLLVTRAMEIHDQEGAAEFRLPKGIARVFIYAPMPIGFHIQSGQLGEQTGRVLYAIDVSTTAVP